MSFIDQFLDATANLPREIIRLLKLLQFVEKKSKNINDKLKDLRINYLKNINQKSEKEEEGILSLNAQYLKELMNLSDYKLNLIEDLKYIINTDFLQKLTPIIKEGQKEVKEELPSTMQNGTNSNYNKNTIEDKNIIIFPDKNKKNDKMLGNKTNRANKNFTRKRNVGNFENYEEFIQNNDDDNKLYCTCRGPSYGKMIECDICHEWFHYKCVGIDEKSEPDNWKCKKCEKEEEENNNINISNNISNNKTKKKERGNKKKKYNQK